jgi:hypothetical protein
MAKLKYIALLLALPLLTLISCQKDKDEIYPKIIFEKPFENSSFNVMDTAFISASVSDESKLEKIEIGLADENFTPKLRTYNYPFSDNPQKILFEYPINDKRLPSGDYYFFIRADDGTNVKHKYRKIRIYELEKEYLGLIAITKNQSNYFVLYIDSQNNTFNKLQFQADSIKTSYNSLENQFSILGLNNTDFQVFDFPDFNQLWSVNNFPNPPFPYFTDLKILDNRYYISFYEGEVKSFNSFGQKYKSYKLSDSYYAVNSYLMDDFLIFDEKNISNNLKQLEFYSYSGGGLIRTFQHQYEIQNILRKSDNELVFFTTDASGSQIRIFELDNNNSWTHKTLSDKIISAAQIDADNYVFCTSSNLYWYKYSNSNMVAVSSLINAKSVSYDDVNNRIIVGHNNGIEFFSFPNANSLGSINISDELVDFHIVYNK